MDATTTTARTDLPRSSPAARVALLVLLLLLSTALLGAAPALASTHSADTPELTVEIESEPVDPPEIELVDPPEIELVPPPEIEVPSTPEDEDDADEPMVTPEDIDDLVAPGPRPSIEVTAHCERAEGFHYALHHPTAPQGTVYAAQWRVAPDGPVQHLGINSKAGFVASGEGDFQVRGVAVVAGEAIHTFGWTDVTVDCGDLVTPEPTQPTPTIDLTPRCEPDAAIAYDIDIAPEPDGPLAYTAQWRVGGGDVQTVHGEDGVIASGEGTFEVRGVVHAGGPGFHATDFVEVVIDCDAPQDPPDQRWPDAPRPGTPTFTG